jgi:hypothetical protein
MVPWPEIITTNAVGSSSLSRASTSRPSMPGIFTSRKITSGRDLDAASIPARPSSAVATWCPSYSNTWTSASRIPFSSSTTSRRAI